MGKTVRNEVPTGNMLAEAQFLTVIQGNLCEPYFLRIS
jgi:hypothetical protein